MPIRMTLDECLLICRYYESLQWHINTVRPTGEFKAMDGLTSYAEDQDPGVMQEGLNSQLYIQINQRVIVLRVELYIKFGSALQHLVCFICNKQGHYSRLCQSQSTTTNTPNSNRNTRGSWCGRGRGNRGWIQMCCI